MELLKNKILSDGRLLPGDVLKVDGFLNRQIDVPLISACGAEWKRLFCDAEVTKILTIEASGIGIACLTAQHFGVPVVFAKKSGGAAPADCYTTKVVSYTHGQTYNVSVPKQFINEGDKILIIDDFLANGSAIKALISLAEQGGAEVVGVGVAIEKVFQNGGNEIRAMGYRVEALAMISSMSYEGGIKFC